MNGSGDSADEKGEWEWKVLCLDKKNGQVLWDKTAHRGEPKFKRHTKATHANCTPATDGRHVAAFFASEGLYCFDVRGELRWKKDLGPLNAAPAGAPDLQWGFAGSPILHDGKVIVQCDVIGSSFWAVFDAKDGRELRRVTRNDDPTWCTPSVHVGKDVTQLICNGYKRIAGYNLATGDELWHLQGGGDVPVPRPVITGERFILTAGHGKSPIFAVRADARGDLTPTDDSKPEGLAWWHKVHGSYMPTPIVVQGLVFVANDNGILTALDAGTGEKVFRERLPGSAASTYSASAVAADGRLYVTSESGQVDVIRAARTFEVLASNQMGEVCMATPAISDGLLLVRGTKHLFCLGR
jgi:outer membrane protein assembly factor BamB